MSVELTDEQFLMLLSLVDRQRTYSTSTQAKAVLALGVGSIPVGANIGLVPKDFQLTPLQNAAIRVGVEANTRVNEEPVKWWICDHIQAPLQWVFVKARYLLERRNDDVSAQDGLDQLSAAFALLFRAQVGMCNDERSLAHTMNMGVVAFIDSVMDVKTTRWESVTAIQSALQECFVGFKRDLQEAYERVKTHQVRKFAQVAIRSMIMELLNGLFDQKMVSKVVLNFINDVWLEVLVRVHLQYGEDSHEWHEIEHVTAAMSRFFSNADNEKDDLAHCNRINALIEQHGLPQDDDTTRERVADMQALLLGALYGDMATSDPTTFKPFVVPDPWDAVDVAAHSQAVEQVKGLKVGHWVLFKNDASGNVAQQLVATVPQTGHFVFSNKTGIAVTVQTITGFIDAIDAGQVEFVGGEDHFSNYGASLVEECIDLESLTAQEAGDDSDQGTSAETPEQSQAIKAAKKMLSRLSIGDWVELHVENRGMVRCKMALRLPSVRRYGFVSPLGTAVAELHEDELARRYVNGELRILQSRSGDTLESLIADRASDPTKPNG